MLYDYLLDYPQETKMTESELAPEKPISYQGAKYERSNVNYVHLSLPTYLAERGLELSEQLNAILGNMPNGTYIAGGSVAAAICGALPNAAGDVDLFFHDAEAHSTATRLLRFAGKQVIGPQVPEGVEMFEPRQDSEGLPIQTINIQWFENIEQLIDGFDFTCCQFGIDVGKKELVFNPVSVTDYTRGLLLNHRYEKSERLNKRIAKYMQKMFIPVGVTKKIAQELGLWK